MIMFGLCWGVARMCHSRRRARQDSEAVVVDVEVGVQKGAVTTQTEPEAVHGMVMCEQMQTGLGLDLALGSAVVPLTSEGPDAVPGVPEQGSHDMSVDACISSFH